MGGLDNGINHSGRVIIVVVDFSTFESNPFRVIPNRGGVVRWSSGVGSHHEDTCCFAHHHGVVSMSELLSSKP